MSAATLRDEDIAEALAIRRLGIVEELEAIEVFEIEGERTFGTVDLDLDMIFAPERKAGSFQIGESAFLKAPDEREFRIDDPVLSVTGAVMENFTEGAFIDHFLG